MDLPTDPVARVIAYHERTKHHPNRYARAPGYMDWATQPDAFRTYSGAPRVDLPLAADEVTSRYCDLYVSDAVPPSPLGLESVAAFFELALGLTAWKEFEGSRWALRSDPSSGNLHPTEGYAVLPVCAGLPAGVHHYVSRDHCLEQRCRLTQDGERELARLLPDAGFLVGIASIHWREAWKYGERAFRYCQHDAGHVIATVRYAAAALGWSAWLLDGFGDALVARVLGLDRDQDFACIDDEDREHPDVMLLIAPRAEPRVLEGMQESAVDLAELVAGGAWSGTPNVLSSGHQSWDVIDAVAEAGVKPPSTSRFSTPRAEGSIV
ncbi:MAG: SagB/ThcOx family dehydrogenase, partial [Planctomycetota bacterium]